MSRGAFRINGPIDSCRKIVLVGCFTYYAGSGADHHSREDPKRA